MLAEKRDTTILWEEVLAALDQRAVNCIDVTDWEKMIEATASGSITYGVPVNGDTVIVNGTTFTKVAAAPGAGEFSNAAELELLVEAVAGVNSSEAGGIIAVTAASAGFAGNAITLALGAGNTGTMAISGATLTGGQDHAEIVLQGVTKTQGTDWNAETSNTVTAANIATELNAEAGFDAVAVGSRVYLHWTTPGTAGNAKTLTLGTNTLGATILSETFVGGVAATYFPEEGFSTINEDAITSFAAISESGASSPVVDITPQVSVDRVNWVGETQIPQIAGDLAGNIKTTDLGEYMRYKIVCGGVDNVPTIKLTARKASA